MCVRAQGENVNCLLPVNLLHYLTTFLFSQTLHIIHSSVAVKQTVCTLSEFRKMVSRMCSSSRLVDVRAHGERRSSVLCFPMY
jgi:2-C-methyl-D-erythritol 4-phosphate cytidylyltransferase